MPIKSLLEIGALKRNWNRDPSWDIEDTEGFEDHREELLQYSQECKARWEEARKKEHDRLAAKICPRIIDRTITSPNAPGTVIYIYASCLVEACAWWNEARGCCAIKAVTKEGKL